MARVKIKYRNPSRKSKLQLLEILSSNQVQITKILIIGDGFVTFTLNDDEAEEIFQDKTRKKLEEKGFSPLQPPELRVKKSVLIFRVDDIILDNSAEEIKEEIQRQNSWITSEIENVFKFPRSPIIKVTFS